MKLIIASLALLLSFNSIAQKAASGYIDSLTSFQHQYVDSHEVVKGKDRAFLQFFPVNNKYRVVCHFERIKDSTGFIMKTSGTRLPLYFKYGKLSFTLDGQAFELFIYQSKDLMGTKEYKDYLFIPFTDNTTADESYGGGRYIDLTILDIRNNSFVLDFNKAYNPYCAYVAGYNCPLPPKENYLPVDIRAGEKVYGKPVH